VSENKRGLPDNFFSKYTKGYIEELSSEKIINRVMDIEIEKISPDVEQPRKYFSEDSLKELASSIKEKGVLEPILVRRVDSKYIIISGERRWKASILAGKKNIPAIVLEPRDAKEIREIQIIENLQREDISPIERAKVIYDYLKPFTHGKKLKSLLINYRMGRKIPEDLALTVSALCKIIGKTPITIIRWLSLLELPEDMQKKLDDPLSPITSKHIETLIKLNDLVLMRNVIKIIEKENLSSEEAEEIVKKIKKRKANDPLKAAIRGIETVSKRLLYVQTKKELEKIKEELLIIKDLAEELIQKIS
jgi:ParB family chromosome partitioning protein